MQMGFIGVEKTGRTIIEKLFADGHEIYVWNRSKELLEEMRVTYATQIVDQKFKIYRTVEDLAMTLRRPAVIWLMRPAGEETTSIIDELTDYLKPGDMIIDGGDAYYRDTQKRFEELQKKEIKFLGIGLTGGKLGEQNGYSLMVGGDNAAYEYIKPILDTLSKPNGAHAFCGMGGAGHFAKMVHNAMEQGMLAAMSEGFEVLARAPYSFDLPALAKLLQKGTAVGGYLLERIIDILGRDPALEQQDGKIETTGEIKWAIDQAKEEHVSVDIIEKANEIRSRSQYDRFISDSFSAKLTAAVVKEISSHTPEKEQKQ